MKQFKTPRHAQMNFSLIPCAALSAAKLWFTFFADQTLFTCLEQIREAFVFTFIHPHLFCSSSSFYFWKRLGLTILLVHS